MNRFHFAFAVVGFFVYASFAHAEMTSSNFKIRWDSVSTGGSDTASSASYLIRDTAESSVAGSASSTTYQLSQGYRAGVDDQILTFVMFLENASTERTATGVAGTTVTASVSGLSVGQMIALIQDVGASQVTAIGNITSIGSGVFTVDTWKHSGSMPVIDGTNDVVVVLNGSSVDLGTLSSLSVSTGIIAFEVTISNDDGYVVQLAEDGNLRSGADEIADVADAEVTAGSEEYGARSSDTSLSTSTFDTQDSAITSAFQSVASESTASFASRNFITLKASIDSATPAGSYAHTISLIASGMF